MKQFINLMETILVTGSGGQLGLSLVNLEKEYPQFKFLFTNKHTLNILDFEELEKFIVKKKVTLIINCAAYTNVDKAEDEEELAYKINCLAVQNIGQLTKKHQLKLIHISTDYVFDGTSEFPYKEIAITNPQNKYGHSKLEGENELLKINPPNTLIIRTSWLYAPHGKNFVKTILKLCEEKDCISVVNDQIGSPTYAVDLASTILKIIPFLQTEGVQIFHYANSGKCSWYQFAKEIIKISNRTCKIEPITSQQFKTKAKRPKFSLLNTEKIQQTFDIKIPYWETSLKKCINLIN